MGAYAAKVLLTALVVVAVTELAKRGSAWSAALASLPLTSVLAFVWLHLDGAPTEKIATLSRDIFWLVLPSLVLFALLPLLLRAGLPFWLGLGVSCAATALSYGCMLWLLPRVGLHG